MKYRYYIVDVFSDKPFAGNQLAVLPNAGGLSAAGMQRIAREFNFAETTFVLPPSRAGATCCVKIFTPKSEVPFAGHPTIGTACALVLGNHLGGGGSCELVFEEGIGLVPVRVEKNGSALKAMLTLSGAITQPAERPPLVALARALTLPTAELIDGFYCSVGLPFCFARLSSAAAVDRAAIDRTAWAAGFEKAWSSHIFFFSGDLSSGSELYARMSAPALGVEEDPATGSACAALVGFAAGRSSMDDTNFTLHVVQGVAMGRRSEITAVASKRGGKVVSVGVGGATSYVAMGDISVPQDLLDASASTALDG